MGRATFGIVLNCIATLVLAFGLIEGLSGSLVDRTIENSRTSESSFRQAGSLSTIGKQRGASRRHLVSWRRGRSASPAAHTQFSTFRSSTRSFLLKRCGALTSHRLVPTSCSFGAGSGRNSSPDGRPLIRSPSIDQPTSFSGRRWLISPRSRCSLLPLPSPGGSFAVPPASWRLWGTELRRVLSLHACRSLPLGRRTRAWARATSCSRCVVPHSRMQRLTGSRLASHRPCYPAQCHGALEPARQVAAAS